MADLWAARQRLALAAACERWALPADRVHAVAAASALPPSAAVLARAAAEDAATGGALAAVRALRCTPGAAALLEHGVCVGARECDDSVSRSLTIWLALWRLGLLPRRCGAEGPLRVLVLGAQAGKEGNSPALTATHFQVLRQLLGWSGVTALELLLCGPEVGTPTAPPVAVGSGVDQEHQQPDAHLGCSSAVTVEYLQGLYHEVGPSPPVADLVVCFQPGIWGYASWEATVKAVMCGGAPMVITSYSWAEADDDCGALEEWGLPEGEAWVWELEPNPYAAGVSRVVEQPRVTAGTGAETVAEAEAAAAAAAAQQQEEEEELGARTLHDNHHWQCLRWAGVWTPPDGGDGEWEPAPED